VIDAFNDVQRALADQERARNEAQAYANDILPRARRGRPHPRGRGSLSRLGGLARQGEAQAF